MKIERSRMREKEKTGAGKVNRKYSPLSLCNCKKSENLKEFEILINSNSNNSNVSFILSSLITNSTFSSFSFPFQLQPSLPSSSSHFFYNVHVSIFSNTTPSPSQTKQYSPLSSLFLFHVC